MKQYYPEGDTSDFYNVYGYGLAQTLVHVLKQSGDDLTRDNIMRQAASLREVPLPLLLPGITVSTSADDYLPFQQLRLRRFDGKSWIGFDEILDDG